MGKGIHHLMIDFLHHQHRRRERDGDIFFALFHLLFPTCAGLCFTSPFVLVFMVVLLVVVGAGCGTRFFLLLLPESGTCSG